MGIVAESNLYYAVIAARQGGKWLFVQEKGETTWEMPAGRRKLGESILETAKRELFEETGALTYTLREICDYSVTEGETRYGRLFFAEVKKRGPLPDLEIARLDLRKDLPSQLTYPLIQPLLFAKIRKKLAEPGR
ncbi:MAG: NUDIX domain-containing protein [Firmicutes bacterium]|nr:NUDIX domain-containing protein [Bacillota bacterium]